MDPITCCLLGICCPPLMRRKKITAYIASFGVNEAASEKLADDLIAKVDALMATTFGSFLKQVALAAMKHEGEAE